MAIPRIVTIHLESDVQKTLVFGKRRLASGHWAVSPSKLTVSIPLAEIEIDAKLFAALVRFEEQEKIHATDESGATISLAQLGKLTTVTNATRPDADTYGPGDVVWNSDDSQLNVSDGTNWRDVDGNLT